MKDLSFPIRPFRFEPGNTEQHTKDILSIQSFAGDLETAVKDIKEEQLEWPYRPDGWTIRQVIHHCADSHGNGITRFKLALTEDNPRIKPYDQDGWAALPDVSTPIVFSLGILYGLHMRWAVLLQHMSPEDFNRTFFHPERDADVSLYEMTALYGWHSRHHLAHVKQALESGGQYQ
ncbi:MAG: putative metal-dependent hydrolase [Flavobacteriales bacterium]|nr:putative metal-dependent hydrolase [Flavobacteriales bacterium]